MIVHAPGALRKGFRESKNHPGAFALTLGYRPPYRWKEMLDFMAGRSIAGVEKVDGDSYSRVVRVENGDGKICAGWIRVAHHPDKDALVATICASLVSVLPQVLARIRHLFDLCCDPDAVYDVLHIMDELKPGLCVRGRRVPGSFEPFETAARAILGQQITVKAASTLAGRMARELGTPVETGMEGLNRAFPTAREIMNLGANIQDRLGALGIIGARAACIHALAKAVENGEIRIDQGADPEMEIKKLQAIKGIGSWTAQYIAMRTMGWPDAFLETDAGVKQALPGRTPRQILEMAEKWRPWRSYAVINLWFGGK